MLAIALLSTLLMTACTSAVKPEIKEPVETPSEETPLVEEPAVRIYMEDYIVPEMDLSVTTDKLSKLSDEELEKGMVLGDIAYTLFSLEVRNKETPGENPRLLIEKIGKHMTKRFLKQIEGELASEIEEAENEDNIKDKLGNIIEKREDGSVLRIDDSIKQGDLIDYDVTGSHIAYSREIKYTIREYVDKDTNKGTILREETKTVFLWFKVEDGEIKLNGYGL